MRRPLLLLAALCTSSATFGADEPGSLRQEREMFPDVIETITGKFVRHSPAFCEWQIKDRQAKLDSGKGNPVWQDNLAFAYARSGNLDKAIETMAKVAKTPPDRFETYANLALFQFLKNDFESSLTHLEKARAIRPNAPAGREQWLQWLAEYRLEKPTRRFPIAPIDAKSESTLRPRSFAIFLRTKLKKPDLDLADAQAAAQGLVEIMRAVNHESVFLLEALGDVLMYTSDASKSAAPRLAARAYLRAGYLLPQPGVRKAYITLAEWALTHRTGRENFDDAKETMPVLTRSFAELDDAKAWYDSLQAKEKDLLANSPDPEADFRRQFAEPPRVPDDPSDSSSAISMSQAAPIAIAAGIGALLVAVVCLVVRRRRKARAVAERSSNPPGEPESPDSSIPLQ